MYDMALLLTFADGRVESAYRRHFSAAQLSLDVVFNAVLSAVTLSSTVKFWRECTPLERVLMPCMVAVSCAVPLAIWLRREAFLHHREPLLAFKHLGEAVVIAHVMPRKVHLSPRDYPTFLIQWLLFAPQVVWPVLGIGFRFLLPAFLPLQGVYTALIIACNGRLYDALKSAYPEYMRHFLGWPGARAALGLGQLSDRAATLAVWATLQFELAFALPLYVVYMWELRDRQRFGKARAERLPREDVNSDQARIRFALAPVAPAWRLGLVAASAAAPFIATLAAAWQDTWR